MIWLYPFRRNISCQVPIKKEKKKNSLPLNGSKLYFPMILMIRYVLFSMI
jgi:hypothetical protein